MALEKAPTEIRILLVEDQEKDAGRIKTMLGQCRDFTNSLHVAESLTEALTALSSWEFDIILLNLFLPDSSGMETLERLGSAAPRLPVIVLADAEQADLMTQTAEHGAQDYLPKARLDESCLRRAMIYALRRNSREQALRAEAAKFRGVSEAMEDGYYELNLSGEYTYVNEAVCRHQGRTRDELIGLNGLKNRKHVSEEQAKKVFAIFNKVYRTGNPSRIVDYEIFRKDGSSFIAEVSVSLQRDASGRPTGFYGISRDVTEQRIAQRALAESEEKYRTILTSIEDAYFEVDFRGQLVFFNEAMAKTLGYSPDKLYGMGHRNYMDEQNAAKASDAFKKIYQTGRSNLSLVYEITRPDGSRRHMESAVSLMHDRNGRPSGFRGIARDITKRKMAEQELADAKQRAEAATRAKSEFLANMSHEIRTPMNGVIGMYNLLLNTELTPEQFDFVETGKRSAEALLAVINDILDFSKIEAGKLDIDTVDFNLRKTIAEIVALPAMQAQTKGLEYHYQVDQEVPSLLRGDPGRLRQIIMNLSTNAVKFTKQGEVVLRVSLEQERAHDVTVRFVLQDTGIGISQAVQARLFNAFEQADNSTTRKYGGTGLGLAISKMLVQLMGGRIGLESQEGQGTTFWFTAVFEKQPNVGKPNDSKKAVVVPKTIRGKRILVVDDNQTNLDILSTYLKQWGCICDTAPSAKIALPLMHAVVKAGAPYDLVISDMLMPEMDGAELGRRIMADPALKETLLIVLTSQGMRGDAADMKRIGFSAYLTKPVRRSLLFDCIITVLNLTQAEREAKDKAPLVTHYSLSEERRRTTRILLAEDNAINRKLAMHLLQSFGFQADAVDNGREAVEALQTSAYDLVLMDVQMPEMDGLEATQIIRAPESRVLDRSIPIIALTAHAMKGDRDLCFKAGMDDYVPKPIQPDDLLRVIERHLPQGGGRGGGTSSLNA